MKHVFFTIAVMLGLTAATQAQTLPAYLPTDGLVGWWPFNGNANDESGNGNNGTVNGATLTADRFGATNSAYNFSVGHKFISVPNITLSGSSFSISMYMYENSLGLGNGNFFLTQGSPNNTNSTLVLYHNPYGIIRFGFWNNDIDTDTLLNNLNWNHLVFTYNSVSGERRIYYNGLSVANDTASSFQGSGLLYFGKPSWVDPVNWPNTFDGLLDDIAIYNRALTQEEVTALYTGEPINPPTACNPLPANLQNGLVGYWPFCGNANDESGNGNDGAVNGATLTEDRFGVANSAYSFDGVDDDIVVNHSDVISISNTNQVSIQAFAKRLGQQSTMHVMGKRINGCGSIEYQIGYCENNCQLSSVEGLGFGSNPESYVLSNLLIDTINWYHIVGTFDGLNWKLYVNNLLVGTDINSNFSPNLGDLIIGASGTCQNWEGSLDDIGIWNRALTADEVQQLYTLNACTFTVYDTVTVTQTVYDTVTTYTSVTDTLIINTLITELAPPANSNTIKVFPNPANSHITIDYGNFALMNGYQLRIENSLGQQVFQTNITQQSDYLSLSTWGGNGLYFVHIVDPQGNTIDIRKIVLQ